MSSIYLIGSLRNPKVPEVAAKLRAAGHDVFDDWFAAGPEADDYWKKYEQERGHNYKQALAGFAANHVYNFDKHHIDRCEIAVLMLPAGKSGHLELGYAIGSGKKGYILFDEEMPADRWDVMYKFATAVYFDSASLIKELESKPALKAA
jgi:nucleoside 2-deoxyribosyltransferase